MEHCDVADSNHDDEEQELVEEERQREHQVEHESHDDAQEEAYFNKTSVGTKRRRELTNKGRKEEEGNSDWQKLEHRNRPYVGVSLKKSLNKWQAEFNYNGRKHHIGTFALRKDAAIAYDKARLKFGPPKKGAPRPLLNFASAPWATTLFPQGEEKDNNNSLDSFTLSFPDSGCNR